MLWYEVGGEYQRKSRDIGAEFAETGFDDVVGGYTKSSKKRGGGDPQSTYGQVINETA